MMKIRIIALLAVIAITMSSCQKDEVDELKDRIGELESDLGFDTPMSVDFATKNSNNVDVVLKKSFKFKAGDGESHYIEDNGDGTYEIYVERFADVEWQQGSWIYFEYEPATGTVTSQSARVYFYDQFYNWVNQRFDPNIYSFNELVVTVSSFDPVKGYLDVTLVGATTSEASNNEYAGKAMTCIWKFKGNVPVYIN